MSHIASATEMHRSSY